MNALKRIFSWLAVFAFMGVIFYLSHQPTLPIPMRFPYQDKVFHFFAYFVLAFLWGNALQAKDRKRLALAILLTALYGISDEFHQSFVPGRESSLADWIADCFGAVFGAGAFFRMRKTWRYSRALAFSFLLMQNFFT